MAQCVVNVFEVVKIEKHDANHGALTFGLRQGELEPVQGKHAVGQPGQNIVIGLAQKLLLIALADADILAQYEVASRFACPILNWRNDQLFPEPLSVAAHAVNFTLPDTDPL